MTREEASLIVRMDHALADEGIGPSEEQPGDSDLVNRAIGMVRSDFPAYWFEEVASDG